MSEQQPQVPAEVPQEAVPATEPPKETQNGGNNKGKGKKGKKNQNEAPKQPVATPQQVQPEEVPQAQEASPAAPKEEAPKPEAPKEEVPKAEPKKEEPKKQAAPKKEETKPKEPAPSKEQPKKVEPKSEPKRERAAELRRVDSEDDIPERVLPKVDTFQYDVELDSKEDFAQATKLAMLERKNQKLLDQVEELEDKLFDAEENVSNLRRKLQVAEEEASDFQALLDQREAQNALLRQDLASLQEKLDAEIAKRNNIDAERRKFEHRIAILETEVEQNAKAQQKLDSAMEEIDSLRHKGAELLTQNGELEMLVERRSGEVTQLEKKLRAEMARSREHHNKTVADMEKLIEAEKKRGQQAIDYVRNTLKSRIQVLQLKLDDGTDTFASHKKEKRGLEKSLKQISRIVEEQRAQATRDARRIESLERQLKRSKERADELLQQRNELEATNFNANREIDTLKAQYDAAIHINAKLNAQVPLSVRINVEEEVAAGTQAPPDAPVSKPVQKEVPKKEVPKQQEAAPAENVEATA